VTVGVVDRLEAIEIDEQQADLRDRQFRGGERVSERFVEVVTVGEPGQLVMMREVIELRLLPFGQRANQAVAGAHAGVQAVTRDDEAVVDVARRVLDDDVTEVAEAHVLIDDQRRRLHELGGWPASKQFAAVAARDGFEEAVAVDEADRHAILADDRNGVQLRIGGEALVDLFAEGVGSHRGDVDEQRPDRIEHGRC
jgi:hypothetical protein